MRLRALKGIGLSIPVIVGCALMLPRGAAAQPGPQYYGSAIQMDVLDNQPVAESDVDYRFRAAASGPVTSFQWFNVYKKYGSGPGTCDGYGCGTGGTISMCIYNDDGTENHLWAGDPLSCVSSNKLRAGEFLRTDVFSVAPVLAAGKLYHLHWHNADPDPAKNYISVDGICVWHPTTPRQPTVPDTDLAVLSGVKVVATDTPIFQLNYADGTAQGQGYKESWIGFSEPISGQAMVREKIAVTGRDRTVTGVSVRVNRAAGTGPLTVTLATDGGAVLERAEIPPAQFPRGDRLMKSAYMSQYALSVWGSVSFVSAHKLSAGQRYQLILSAPSDTEFQTYGIQRASGYNYSPSTYFADGYGQFSHDGGATWRGFSQSETITDGRDADIQFYFTVAP